MKQAGRVSRGCSSVAAKLAVAVCSHEKKAKTKVRAPMTCAYLRNEGEISRCLIGSRGSRGRGERRRMEKHSIGNLKNPIQIYDWVQSFP